MLTLSAVRYSYPSTRSVGVALDSLTLDPGEQLVLTGTSGSGKSTLLHLIAGLMEPDSGSIVVAGTDIHRLRAAKRDRFRGRSIGMVFQTFNLLQGFSAAENVMAALMFSDIPRGAHAKRAASLLGSLGITTPGQLVEQMSVGQQQRVAVARAIACSPALVLADEPTASLDPDHAESALNLLQDACRSSGAALLCVTHDTRVIDRFDRHECLHPAAVDQSREAGAWH